MAAEAHPVGVVGCGVRCSLGPQMQLWDLRRWRRRLLACILLSLLQHRQEPAGTAACRADQLLRLLLLLLLHVRRRAIACALEQSSQRSAARVDAVRRRLSESRVLRSRRRCSCGLARCGVQ